MSKVEKYKELANDIIKKIDDGVYKVGYKLQTENVIASQYKVSRHTVRKALEYLSVRGYVATRQGSGSFITNETAYRSLDISSFTENHKHLCGRTEVISFEKTCLNDELEKKFGLPEGNMFFRWTRLRYLKDEPCPIQVEFTVMPEYLVPNIKLEDLYNSVYRYIENTTGYNIAYALKEISPALVDEKLASLLKIDEGNAAILICNQGFLTNGEMFEFSVNYHVNQTIKYYAKRL